MSNQINQTKDASPIIQDLTTLKYTYCICHYRICSKEYLISHGKSNIANQRLFITTQKNYRSSFAKNSESCFIEAISTVELVNIEVQSLFLNRSRELGHQIHSEEIFDNWTFELRRSWQIPNFASITPPPPATTHTPNRGNLVIL